MRCIEFAPKLAGTLVILFASSGGPLVTLAQAAQCAGHRVPAVAWISPPVGPTDTTGMRLRIEQDESSRPAVLIVARAGSALSRKSVREIRHGFSAIFIGNVTTVFPARG